MKLNQTFSLLLVILLIIPAAFAFNLVPVAKVYASSGQPKLGAVSNVTSIPTAFEIASSNVSVSAGSDNVSAVDGSAVSNYHFTIIFGDNNTGMYVDFSGAQFYLYISKDGFSALSSSDIKYGPRFDVADLTGALKAVSGYYIGKIINGTTEYYVVIGAIPLNLSKDYTFIKIFDGSSTAVAVSQQKVLVQPGLSVTPDEGAAHTPVTISGGGFPENTLINITTAYGDIVTLYNTSIGYFTILNKPMVDTKSQFNGSNVPLTSDTVTINAIENSTGGTLVATTFTEWNRYFELVNSTYGTNVNSTESTFPTNCYGNNTITVNAWISGTVVVEGNFFYANSPVNIYIGSSKVATATANGTGFFHAEFTVPELSMGNQVVKVIDGNSVMYTFTLDIQPTLVLDPSSGVVGTSVTGTAYGFPANSVIALYWDSTSNLLLYATTGSNGKFNVTVAFTVPHDVGDDHNVLAYNNATGIEITSAPFTIVPKLEVVPSEFSNNGSTFQVIGTGVSNITDYTLLIDHSYLGLTVKGNSTGDMIVEFVAAGFRPGLHVVALVDPTDTSHPESFNAVFTVKTDGDLVINAISSKIDDVFSSIQTSLNSISANISSLSDTVNAGFASLSDSVSKLSTTLSSVASKLGDIETALGDVQSKLSALSDSVSKLSTTLSSVTSKLDSVASSLGNLATKSDLSSLATKSDVSSLATKSDVGNIASGVNKLSSGVTSTIGSLSNLITATAILVIITLIVAAVATFKVFKS